MKRPTIRSLIEQDLGYCCVWFFFSRFRQTGLVADRLGFSRRSVREFKATLRDTREGCQNRPGCLDCKITLDKKLRVRQAL